MSELDVASIAALARVQVRRSGVLVLRADAAHALLDAAEGAPVNETAQHDAQDLIDRLTRYAAALERNGVAMGVVKYLRSREGVEDHMSDHDIQEVI